MRVTSKEAGLWLLSVMAGLGGCDGTAIFIPEDNTRLSWSEVPPTSAAYGVQVLLDEDEHAWASDPNNDWYNLFRLEGYSDLHGWHEVLASPPHYTGIPVTLPTGTSYWWRFDIELDDLETLQRAWNVG